MKLIPPDEQEVIDHLNKAKEIKPPKILLAYGVSNQIKPATAAEQIFLLFSGLFPGFSMCVGSSLPLARNTVVQSIYEQHPDFTHILFIDGDIKGVNADLVRALYAADKDIIGPLCVTRAPPFDCITCFYGETNGEVDISKINPAQPPPELKQYIEQKKLVRVRSVATGCCLIKRAVFDRLGETTSNGGVWFTFDRHPRENFLSDCERTLNECYEAKTDDPIKNAFIRGTQLGLTAHIGSPLPSEDNEFCWKAAREGFEVWCHCGYEVLHIGDCGFGMEDHYGWRSRLEQGVTSLTLTKEQ